VDKSEMGFNLKGLKENDKRFSFVPFEFFEVRHPFVSWMPSCGPAKALIA
jgi:hypothetical protein